MLKSMGKNLLEGKSIMNVSLPIIIFSRDTLLMRAVAALGYAPHFLNKAAKRDNYLEAFEDVITFFFTM